MLIVLFFKCMTALLSLTYRRGEGIKWGLVSYTVVMFALATVLTGMDLDIQSISYVDNRDYSSIDGSTGFGPFGYFLSIYFKPINVIPSAAYIFGGWLADGLLVGSLFDAAFTHLGV